MPVKGGDGFHIVVGEAEAENVEILFHALAVCAFGDSHYALLREPAQGDLSGGFAVALPYLHQDMA